ncbi:MAG: ATP-dependent DNA helicase UvrD2 [Actinobacteria bacterium]|nr:ATP-dependent DNA helicase UvrD2 [Actinomycetota bacterium]
MDVDEGALLSGLDAHQGAAVVSPAPMLCILAGAGSGKTRVLTRRIAYRCANGSTDARHVLALTFTRKAAGELGSRLRRLGLRDLPTTGTFHAVAWAQLHTRWKGLGQSAPALLDRKSRLLAPLLGRSARMSVGELATEIEWARARLVAPDGYAAAAARADRRTGLAHAKVAELYARYENEKRMRGLVDFDDLLARCADAMVDDPAFAAAQRWRFRHLFVDEYQDVNPLQHRLLSAWAGDRRDLCVVGDPNQAIYRWNGADASFLVRFAEHHPGAEVIELVDSYRSTPEVLAVAAAVLDGGAGRVRPLAAHRPSGPVPDIVAYPTDDDEARGVARAVRDAHQPGGRWARQAILVRTNAQTALIEQALRRAGIPYRVRGAAPFLARPDVGAALRELGRRETPARPALADLAATVGAERDARTDEARTDAEQSRLEALEALVRLGDEFTAVEPTGTVQELRSWLAANLQGDDVSERDAVEVVTFHAAKGLEWPVVHLAGLEDGLVPISHARTDEAKAEERRLLYVAVTRAEQALRITWAEERSFGERALRRKPSPYIGALRTATHQLRAAAGEVMHDRGLARARARLEVTHEPGAYGEVLHALHEWRRRVADSVGMPGGIVFGDDALAEVARVRPATVDQLAAVPGVGAVKAAEYGADVLRVLARASLADAPVPGLPR